MISNCTYDNGQIVNHPGWVIAGHPGGANHPTVKNDSE
jgi:hypothetical protein